MAGLPQDRPIPGSPLLDPLGQAQTPILPVAPAPPPVGPPPVPPLPGTPEAIDALSGAPAPQGYLPWPPDEWFATPEGQPPAAYEGHGVPVVENPPAAPATSQAGAAGMGALDQARKDGHLETDYKEAERTPAPPAPRKPRDPYLASLDETNAVRQRATEQEAEAEKAKNLYLSQQGVSIADDQAKRQAAADAEYETTMREAKAKRAELDQEAQNLANTKTDPNRMWHNAGFGAQLAVGIAAALNGWSRPGAPNPVTEQVNKMVERDMQAQAADLENRRGALGIRRGLLADDLAAGRDLLDVRYKSLTSAYTTAENQIKAYAMRFDNPVIDARAATHLADLQDAKMLAGQQYVAQKQAQGLAARSANLQEREFAYRQKNDQANRDAQLELAGLRGQGKISAQDAAAKKEAESLLLDPSGDPIPDGKGGFAHLPSPDKAIEHREKLSARVTYWQKLKKYQSDLEKYGKEFGGAAGIMGRTDAMSMLEEEWADLIPSYLKMHGIQRLTHEDMMLVGGNIIAKPSSWAHSTNPLPAVNQAKKSFRDETNTEMQAVYGVHDKDWLGAYEAAHPEEFKEDATEAKGNYQGREFEPVPMDKTGKIIGMPTDPGRRGAAGLPSEAERSQAGAFDDVPGSAYDPLGQYERHPEQR